MQYDILCPLTALPGSAGLGPASTMGVAMTLSLGFNSVNGMYWEPVSSAKALGMDSALLSAVLRVGPAQGPRLTLRPPSSPHKQAVQDSVSSRRPGVSITRKELLAEASQVKELKVRHVGCSEVGQEGIKGYCAQLAGKPSWRFVRLLSTFGSVNPRRKSQPIMKREGSWNRQTPSNQAQVLARSRDPANPGSIGQPGAHRQDYVTICTCS